MQHRPALTEFTLVWFRFWSSRNLLQMPLPVVQTCCNFPDTLVTRVPENTKLKQSLRAGVQDSKLKQKLNQTHVNVYEKGTDWDLGEPTQMQQTHSRPSSQAQVVRQHEAQSACMSFWIHFCTAVVLFGHDEACDYTQTNQGRGVSAQ